MATPIVTASSRNPYIDGILTENHWSDAQPGPSTRIAFNIVGDDGRTEAFTRGLDDVTGLTNAAEEAAFKLALKLIADVSGLTFVEVATQGAADLLLGAGSAPGQPGALGFASTPGGEATGVKINSDNLATDSLTSLRQGGYDFITVIHEIGHALGLNHPFAGGPFPAFPGVSGPGDLGDNGLGQGVYTVMSYDDGFPSRDGPGDTSVNEGWSGTPMAFDVAALQYLYGVNASHRAGNDTYVLPVGGTGEFYSSLWDAGGVDRILATGAASATIDLRAATLLNAPGGGGTLSAHAGVKGGFTIARGALIENAQGAAGNDRITGNAAGNTLEGNAGNDVIRGLEGHDVLRGGEGRDRLEGGTGADMLAGKGGSDALLGGGGDDRLYGDDGSDLAQGGDGNDLVAGQAGDDTLRGGAGNDVLEGGAGRDRLEGGAGADRFVFTALRDTPNSSPDVIGGWDASDVIDLSVLDNLIAGDLRLVGAATRTGASGEVYVERSGGVTQVLITADDTPGVDVSIRLEGTHALTANDFLL